MVSRSGQRPRMRGIAIVCVVLAAIALAPAASALPTLDPEHPIPSVVAAACYFVPHRDLPTGSLDDSGVPNAHLGKALDDLENDLEDPRATCDREAANMPDIVNIEIETL